MMMIEQYALKRYYLSKIYTMKVLTGVISVLFLFFGFHLRSQDLEEKLRNHVEYLSDTLTEGRGLGTAGKVLAENYIEESFVSAGLQPWKGSYRHSFKFKEGLVWVDAVNFIGFIPGNDPELSKEYIVVGAHYDHLGYNVNKTGKTFYPGADDNASGVASVIEIARMVGMQKENLGRSIIFIAFDAEESGLIGASNIVENNVVPTDSVKIMFSLDMVGMYTAYKGFDLNGIGHLTNGIEWAREVAEKNHVKIKKHAATIEQRTDTAPFGKKGIPAVHVFTGLKSPYHKPEDKSELLDFNGMAAICQFMTDYSLLLSQQIELSSSMGISSDSGDTYVSDRFQWGLTAGMGSSRHIYRDRFYEAKNELGYKGGLWMEYHTSPLFSFLLQAQYDINRSQIQDGVFTRHSWMMPLNLVLSSPTKNTGMRFYLSAGPYYRHNFSAKSDNIKYTLPDQVSDREWGYNMEWGVVFNRYRLGSNFQRALTDTFSENGQYERVRTHGSNFFFSVSLY